MGEPTAWPPCLMWGWQVCWGCIEIPCSEFVICERGNEPKGVNKNEESESPATRYNCLCFLGLIILGQK